ncbi:MAG: aspartate/glutamate racemase family protein [Rubrivivax sp.]
MRFLGVLMLQTRFPRLPGDVGHPGSFAMPVRHAMVAGATPHKVVREADSALLTAFVAAGQALVADGAAALTTSCGFLARWQAQLQAALPVPVWTSSLLALAELGPQRPGVVTVDAAALNAQVLRAAGAPPGVPVRGIPPDSDLARTLLDDLPALDAAAAQRTVVETAIALCRDHPDTGAIVLECTNMPPYRAAVARACGRPVFDIITLVHSRWSGLGR